MTTEILANVANMSRKEVLDIVVAYIGITGDYTILAAARQELVRWMLAEGAVMQAIAMHVKRSERAIYRWTEQGEFAPDLRVPLFKEWLRKRGPSELGDIHRWMREHQAFPECRIPYIRSWLGWLVKMEHIHERNGRFGLDPMEDSQVHLLELINREERL